jgi:uncharacterized membrane protein
MELLFMQIKNILRQTSTLGWSALNIVLLLMAGALPLWAQDAGSTGGVVEHSSKTTTSTTATGPDAVVSGDSNTWILIAIAALAFLILVIALARSASSKRAVTKTTVIR